MKNVLIAVCIGALALAGCDNKEEAKPKAAAKEPAKDGGKPAPTKATDDPVKDQPDVAPTTALPNDDEVDAPADAPADEAAVLAALDKRVTRAAKLAQEIEKAPAKADDILAAADLDRGGFQALIYEIGEDEALSQQYRIAMAGD